MEEIYLKDLMKSKITKKREQKWGVDSNGLFSYQ